MKTKSVFVCTVKQLVRNFFDHNVSKSACALAYNLMFAMFPVLIFVSNLLGLLDLDVGSIIRYLQQILPRDVLELVEGYLDYVSESSSKSLFWLSLSFTVFFPMRAAGGLMDNVRTAYQLGKPKKPILYLLRQVLVMLTLLIAIALILVLTIFGKRVVNGILSWFPVLAQLRIPQVLLTIWHYLRFVIAYLLMFVAIGLLYAAAQDQRQKIRSILPGVGCASVAWLVVSIGFSFYAENFSRYTLIYGTLGAVIVLMTWLYMTSLVLILGAEVNAARQKVLAEHTLQYDLCEK